MHESSPPAAGTSYWNRDDIEPRIVHVLERKLKVRERGSYSARTNVEVTEQLHALLGNAGLTGIGISELSRMTGGASKEQFAFTLTHDAAPAPERLVLRMDPSMGIVETCRGREAQILQAFAGVVPVPPVRFVDADGEHLGQPGLVTAFVAGVTAPSDIDAQGVSGVGTRFDHWIPKLSPQFVGNLARIHAFDWRNAELDYFAAPTPGTTQAALRQVNWWARVWEQDSLESIPLMALTERWLRDNAPVCAEPVVVHGDYRIGNFMFAEPSGDFTAVLDWELAHIGDYHEDLAWPLLRLLCTFRDDGEMLVSGLLTREDFFNQYRAATGRDINPDTIRYYEILAAWKCAVINNATGGYAAHRSQSHQDLVLTWLGCSTAVFLDQIRQLLREVDA